MNSACSPGGRLIGRHARWGGANIGPQLMSRKAGDALNLREALGRDALPHRHGRGLNPKASRDLRNHAALRADTVHSVHSETISGTEQRGQREFDQDI